MLSPATPRGASSKNIVKLNPLRQRKFWTSAAVSEALEGTGKKVLKVAVFEGSQSCVHSGISVIWNKANNRNNNSEDVYEGTTIV